MVECNWIELRVWKGCSKARNFSYEGWVQMIFHGKWKLVCLVVLATRSVVNSSWYYQSYFCFRSRWNSECDLTRTYFSDGWNHSSEQNLQGTEEDPRDRVEKGSRLWRCSGTGWEAPSGSWMEWEESVGGADVSFGGRSSGRQPLGGLESLLSFDDKWNDIHE